MYGTAAPSPYRDQRKGPGAWALTVRVFFALLPLPSLTLLAWVPMLRFAVLRRRLLDWFLFVLSVLMTLVFCYLMLLVPEDDPDNNSPELNTAVTFMLVYGIAATVWAVLGDRFPRPPGGPWVAPHSGPYYHPAAGTAPTEPGQWAHLQQTGPYVPGPAGGPGGGYGHPVASTPAPPASGTQPVHGPFASPADGPQPQPANGPHTPGGSPRMRQVASELDQLDELLRKRGRE